MSLLDEKLEKLKNLEQEIKQLRDKEKGEAIAEIGVLVVKFDLHWMDIKHLFPNVLYKGSSGGLSGKKGRVGGGAKIYYVHPTIPGKVYKGKGPQPDWFKALNAAQKQAAARTAK